MKFITISFAQNILDAALKYACDRCIMIFPTRVSANLARLAYEPNWHFEDITFTTMEDIKSALLTSELPQLEDEKRLLALYQVLSNEDREYFHLPSYNDVVAWGNNFFQFLQEYSDAGRDVNELAQLIDKSELYLRQWQEQHISRIAQILQRYHELIQELGFDDRIFHPPLEQLSIPYQNYRIILVNQFYYSQLEKDLLGCLEQNQNEVWLLYHNLDVDESNWPKTDFDPAKCYQNLSEKPKISVYRCDNEEQHALWLLATLDPEEHTTIIDNQFWQKDYSGWFSPSLLSPPRQIPIKRSCWYKFLAFLNELVQSQTHTPGFVPLSILIKHLQDQRFPALLLDEWDAERQDKLLRELFRLSDKEVLYLDLDCEAQFNRLVDPKSSYEFLPRIAQKLFAMVNEILNLKSTKGLAQLFAELLEPQKLCSADELSKTDILPQIWTAMANFCAVEELGIVKDWEAIFSPCGAGIFSLWLDFVKSTALHYQAQEPSSASCEVSNLLDARNRRFEHLAFLQMEEGLLPQAPLAVWLLNESQRATLGLITYETIRAWERYYFFRLVFCARRVDLFCYRNSAKGIEPSSLVGELKELVATDLSEPPTMKIPFQNVFQSWQDLHMHPLLQRIKAAGFFQLPADSSFWTIPADPQRDFGTEHIIKQSSYELSLLINNPFAWYVSVKSGLKPRKAELTENISPSLFGSLMHAYFAEILGEVPSKHASPQSLAPLFENDEALRLALQQIIQSQEFYYKIPKNYNEEFLSAIISACLADSLQEFYHRFLRLRLANQSFTLLPERRYMSEEELDYKKLCETEYEGQSYQVYIRGRADLRIETPSTRIILDFKTGSAHEEQLMFYEWFYYLINDPSLQGRISSYFWQILDMHIDSEHTVNDAKRAKYLATIVDSLNTCLASGYKIAEKSQYKRILQPITRSDIYLEGASHD